MQLNPKILIERVIDAFSIYQEPPYKDIKRERAIFTKNIVKKFSRGNIRLQQGKYISEKDKKKLN